MANTTIDATAYVGGSNQCWGPYWVDDTYAVVLGINAANDPARYFTSNGGSTWSESAIASETCFGVAAWFDRETPGNDGYLVHVVYGGALGDVFAYCNVDVRTGTVSTPVTIATPGTPNTSPTSQNNMFITRTRNGNLIAGFRDGSSTGGVWRSTDVGASWTGRTDCYEISTQDQAYPITANTGDDADAAVVFWDWSNDELSVKVYDDSANTWTETSISTSMVEEGGAYNGIAAATFRSNGKAFVIAFNAFNTSTADLKAWLIDVSSVASPTITAKTDVLTNSDDSIDPALFIDPRTDTVYAGYLRGSVAPTAVKPFYKASTDTGSTWGTETALTDAAEGAGRGLNLGGTCGSNGGHVQAVWYDGTNSDILTNLVNDVVLTSDVLVEGSPSANIDKLYSIATFHGPYWTSDQVGAIVYLDSSNDIVARKTTDGGQTWGSAVAAEAGTAANGACWFDQETPTDSSGTKIHTAWCDTVAEDLSYAAFDISAGTWSTPVDINAALGVGQPSRGITIQKTRSGNLIVTSGVFGATGLAYKSSDGVSWSSITSPSEGTFTDFALSASVNTGDGNDGAVIFQDTSANQISVKMYDDSANTWTKTTIATLVETNGSYMARAIRRSDGHTILAFWNETDATTADLEVWDLNLNSIAAPTLTAKTSVNTNLAESGDCSVFINQSNDDIYVAYCTGTAYTATVAVFYKKSSDGGSSWGSQQTYSQQIEDDFRIIAPSAMSASNGGRFEVAWCDDDDDDIFVNYNNSVSIAAVSGSLPDGKAVFSTVPRPKRALVVDELISPLTLGIPNEVEGLPTGRAIFDFIPRGKRGRQDQVDQPPLVMGIFQTPPEGKVYYDTTYRGKRGRTDQVDQPPLALGVFHTPPDGRTWLQRNPLPKRGAWVDELKPPQTLGIPDEPIVTPDGKVHTATVLPPKRGRTDQVTQPPLVMGVFHTPPEGRVQYSEPTFRGKRGRADFVLPPPLTLGIPDEPPSIPPGLRYYETTRRGKRGRPDLQWATPRALEAESRVMSPFKPDVQLPRRKPRKIFDSLVRWYFLEESAAPTPTRPKLGLGRGTGRAAQRGRGSASGDNLPRGRATGRH